MFEKTLTDVVKGIRASKRDTALYISQCIAEIKSELQSSDMFVKANALQKLTFLQIMGYSMNWASFATIEVMSSHRFAHKRIGYLAASQGFTQTTEVILLTTNLFQKELRAASSSANMQAVYEAGLAINCISNIVTPELATDLLPELTQLTSHPQPYLRKKAILCLFKLFVQYPQGLRLTFHRLQQCLQDSNPAVVSCAVNVITELSDKQNPKNYLNLAPAFFGLLTSSSNNWMLIKVVKLLGSLVPHEPRLARKLLDPLANIVRTTQAKSLLYEAVHTITLCLPYCPKADGTMPANVPDIVQLSAQTLRSLVQESDQNLKYLGLVGFASLLQSHPRILSTAAHTNTQHADIAITTRPLILACLSDPDVTLRTRALDLLLGIATRKNLHDLVSQLFQHVRLAERGTYRQALVAKIMEICSADKYALLADESSSFQWYFDVLIQLARVRGIEVHAQTLHNEIVNVALRVLPVRTFAVQRSIQVLLAQGIAITTNTGQTNGGSGDDPKNTSSPPLSLLYSDNGRGKDVMPDILPAFAWIVGEYSDLIPDAIQLSTGTEEVVVVVVGGGGNENDDDEPYHALLRVLSSPWNVTRFTTTCQKVFLQAAPKVLAAASASRICLEAELAACATTLESNLPIFMQSTNVEVVERAFTILELLRVLQLTGNPSSLPELASANTEDDDSDRDEDAFMGSTRKPSSSSSSSSLASHIQAVSSTLNSLFKPSPMKPAGAKAQRKKRSAPLGHDIDLEAGLDVSVFSTFLEKETAYLTGAKLSMESVTFTQQRPMQVSSSGTTTSAMGEGMSSSSLDGPSAAGLPFSTGDSFQQSGRPQRNSDPFYLNSNTSYDPTDASGEAEDTSSPGGRFGIIQLPDSDEDDEAPAATQRDSKKKQKKDKKKAKQAKKDNLFPSATGQASDTADFLSFDPHGAPARSFDVVPGALKNVPAEAPVATIYHSDDDEDDDNDHVVGQPSHQRKNKGGRKEFANLSKVDLTSPPKEHEVVSGSNRVHRSVPVPASQTATTTTTSPSAQSKKSKKELKKESKEAKKKRKEAVAAPGSAVVGDLLDLGLVMGNTMSPAKPSTPNEPTFVASESLVVPVLTQSGSGDVISSAFEDLLDLGAPAPAPLLLPPASFGVVQPTTLGVSSSTEAAPSKKTSRLWIRGTIKSNNATGQSLDWSRIRLMSRTYRCNNQGNSTSAMIVVRMENLSGENLLSGLVLNLNDFGSFPLVNASPSSSESQKIGPFVYPEADSSLELKGTLSWSSGSVPVRLFLPAALHLSPLEGLSLEQVAEELSSEKFSLTSLKLGVPNASLDFVKQTICGFLRVGQVLESIPVNPKAATFGAVSTVTGAKVRILVKIKDSGSVKLDIRSTNPEFGNALASDLKKVIF